MDEKSKEPAISVPEKVVYVFLIIFGVLMVGKLFWMIIFLS